MSYTMEGVVAAAPDFGIVPAGILAIFVFQYFPAHRVTSLGERRHAALRTARARVSS